MNTVAKSVVVASIVGVIGIGSLATVSSAAAETTADSTNGPVSGLIDKIASTFRIDKTELQTLFDEDREAREAARETQQAERIQALVDDGTITAVQKTAIEAKMKEMKAERESTKTAMHDLSDDERKAKMDERRSELEVWTKGQGLDLSELRGILGGGSGGPGGHGR